MYWSVVCPTLRAVSEARRCQFWSLSVISVVFISTNLIVSLKKPNRAQPHASRDSASYRSERLDRRSGQRGDSAWIGGPAGDRGVGQRRRQRMVERENCSAPNLQ